jgi:ABC-type glycerol-3-phosphate transport system substrate-binding protein
MIYRMMIALAAVAVAAGVSGCGGNIPEHAFGTPAGTYTFSVTASATGAATATQAITLTVN